MRRGQLDMVDRSFSELVGAEALPRLDAWAMGIESPERQIGPLEVRSLLSDRSTEQAVRDAIWGALVRGAQSSGEPWFTYAAGLMVRSLRFAAQRIVNSRGGDRSDVESGVLVGFVEALKSADPEMRRLSSHLRQAAYRRALTARSEPAPSPRAEMSSADLLRRVPPVAPSGHVDIVLARAIKAGVLTEVEADIIAATRLDDADLGVVAQRLQLPILECAGRRQRAEVELREFIRSGG